MSDTNDHDKQLDALAAPTPSAGIDARALAALRRRRFIKLGATAVPVSMTLASRPVMAWHCNTTSAWGSAVLRNGVASTKTRATNALMADECWTRTELCANSVHAGAGSGKTPWLCIYNGKFSGQSTAGYASKDAYAQAKLLISHLFGSLYGTPGASTNVKAYIAANPSTFATLMLVARINQLYAGTSVAACLSSGSIDELALMASQGPGTYRPSNSTGAAWTLADIQKYLFDNYIST